ncbi:hypothetical protein P7K49_012738, partial [Saguinus oedipus]
CSGTTLACLRVSVSGAGGVGGFRSQSLSHYNVASSTACSSASLLGLGLTYPLPPASKRLDLSQATARTKEYIIRTNEEQLQGLNDRFVVFIENIENSWRRRTKACWARLAEELRRWRARCEEERRGRKGAERALKAQPRDVDVATLARLDLEKKVQSLLD